MSLLWLFNEEVNGTPQPEAYVRLSVLPQTQISIGILAQTLIDVGVQAQIHIVVRLPMDPLNVGDTADVDFDFIDAHTNELVDPTVPPSIRVQVLKPDGNRTALVTYTYGTDINVTKLASGSYRVSLDLDVAGVWQFAIVSPGPTAKATKPGDFEVKSILGS